MMQQLPHQNTVERLLRKRIGLNPDSIGSKTIARAVETRRLACRLADVGAYVSYLQSSPRELEELIEAVVVRETWFFRDAAPFELLGRYATSRTQSTPLRILSVPCSTGEEPYSIAIALLEAGLSPQQFAIDAVDISRQALTKAARAIYSEKSFRGEGTAHARQLYKDWYRPTGRRSHFRQVDGGYELCEEVRRTVTFMHGNLLDAWFLVGKTYEIIFCRNLLIYFDAAARDRTLRVLERLLEDAGLLFVGSAETGQMNKEYFTAVQHPFAFAYHKTHQPVQPLLFPPRTVERAGQPPAETVEVAKLSHPLMLNQKREARNENPRAENSGLRTPPSTSPEDLLKKARRFADRGRLEEAAALCKTYLQTHPTSAYAYGLLGEVAQELGHIEQAEQYFQRAIYLNPQYWEALTHLALLREHRGDLASAVLLRQRVQRVRGS